MSGLNDDFQLDGNPAAFVEDSESLLQPFSADPDFDIVVALENQIIDLQDLAVDIEEADGMSRAFAMEALRILPGVLSVSDRHFTYSPSATRLRVSMEEITKGVWALIAAAVVAVIGVVYKIFKWISGDKSSEGDSTGGSGAAASGAEKRLDANIKAAKATPAAVQGAADAIEEISHSLQSEGVSLSGAALKGEKPTGIGGADAKPYHYSSFDQLISKILTDSNKYEHAKRFLESDDGIFHDIIKGGAYSQAAEQAGKALLSLKDALSTKMKLLDEILMNDIHSSQLVDEWKNTEALEKPALQNIVQLKMNGSVLGIDEVAKKLREAKEKAEHSKTHERINFDKLFEKMATVYKKPTNLEIFEALRDSIGVVADLEARMEKMKKLTDNLAHDGQAGSASGGGVAVRIRQVILTLGKDVYGYAMLAHELKYYAMHSEYLAKEAVGFGTEIVRKVSHAMRVDGQEVPAEWKKLLDTLDKQLMTLRDNYRSGNI